MDAKKWIDSNTRVFPDGDPDYDWICCLCKEYGCGIASGEGSQDGYGDHLCSQGQCEPGGMGVASGTTNASYDNDF